MAPRAVMLRIRNSLVTPDCTMPSTSSTSCPRTCISGMNEISILVLSPCRTTFSCVLMKAHTTGTSSARTRSLMNMKPFSSTHSA